MKLSADLQTTRTVYNTRIFNILHDFLKCFLRPVKFYDYYFAFFWFVIFSWSLHIITFALTVVVSAIYHLCSRFLLFSLFTPCQCQFPFPFPPCFPPWKRFMTAVSTKYIHRHSIGYYRSNFGCLPVAPASGLRRVCMDTDVIVHVFKL